MGQGERNVAGELDRQFGSAPNQRGQEQAYVDPSGAARAVKGDDKAPHLKTPPFTTQIQTYVSDVELPLIASDYLALPKLDCLEQRLLQLYMRVLIGDDEGGNGQSQVSIIPEGLANGIWYVLGVVNPTVTNFVPAGSARFPYALGSRSFAPAELRSPAFSLAAGGTAPFILTFDVAAYEAFRLNVRDIAGVGQTNLFYADHAYAQ